MKHLLFVICVLFSGLIYGQDTLITTQGDTLSGKIGIELPSETFEEITLKNDEGKTRLKAYQFVSFVKDGVPYRTIKLAGVYRIMQVEIDGYLSLYYYRADGSYQFATLYTQKIDGEGLLISNFNFRKPMAKFLSDCETVANDLEEGKYKKSDLPEIINVYNKCISDNTFISKNGLQEVENVDDPAITLIAKMKENLGDGNAELTTLLNDILNKVGKKQSVPGYLQNALIEQTKGNEALEADAAKLIELLK